MSTAKATYVLKYFGQCRLKKGWRKKPINYQKGIFRSFLQQFFAGGAKLLPKTVDGYKCDIVPPLRDMQNVPSGILARLQILNKGLTDSNWQRCTK